MNGARAAQQFELESDEDVPPDNPDVGEVEDKYDRLHPLIHNPEKTDYRLNVELPRFSGSMYIKDFLH